MPRCRRVHAPRRTRIWWCTEGTKGPGAGKHIVLLAGDHEYRSEESLPALARILARHYGFKCSVFFTTNPQTGFIEPGSSNIAGLEALRTADLLVVFLRFQDFPDARNAAHRRLPGTRRARWSASVRRRTPFKSSGPDAKFLKYHWQTGDVVQRRLRTPDPGRDVGLALRHEPQTKLAPAAAGGPGRASDSARREGRVGAVGRLHGASDRGQPGSREGSDSQRHDARLLRRRRTRKSCRWRGIAPTPARPASRDACSRPRTARRRIC